MCNVVAAAFEDWFRRKWVWNMKVVQTAVMFVQRYSMCTMCYVVHKVQSRFLVKQEACFYLCCTEQLLETPALSRIIWLRVGKKTLGNASLYMHKRGSKILQVQTLLRWNDNHLGIYITKWATFCSGELRILMHEALHDWFQTCGWEQKQQNYNHYK